ncbi:MAG: hypothetical protein NUW37_14465, partial [Planctomycetes bacterium]|nr:hypothetical protein [Planctomycetota bacterium]
MNWKIDARLALVAVLMTLGLTGCDSPSSLNLASAQKSGVTEDNGIVASVEASRSQASELRHRGRDDDRGRGRQNSRNGNRLDVTVRIPEGSIDEDARITLSFPARNTLRK